MSDYLGLPRWIRDPEVISNDMNSLDRVGLSEELFSSLGIRGLYAFQSRVRELLVSAGPRDLCVSAPTGSGKTLAYVIPVVEELRGRVCKRVRALVVVPTRELVAQVESVFGMVAGGLGADLRAGLDYLVTTPGRLIDLLSSADLGEVVDDMSGLRYLVVDEADKLLDQSFQEWLPRLLERINNDSNDNGSSDNGDNTSNVSSSFNSQAWDRRVQKLLFSATLTTDPAKIAPLQLSRPIYIKVINTNTNNISTNTNTNTSTHNYNNNQVITPESLKELIVVFEGEEELKPAVLAEVIDRYVVPGGEKALCFTKSVIHAQRLASVLRSLCPHLPGVSAFHGDLSGEERSALLDDFAGGGGGGVRVLVGSDAMARGLDIAGVGVVINYDMPTVGSTYIHRVGRTARAGAPGLAITILPASQTRHFKSILKGELGKRVRVEDVNSSGYNEVGKVELEAGWLEEKWRQKLNDALSTTMKQRKE